MANEEHLASLLNGIAAWNEWRKRQPAVQPDLARIQMPEADLASANLSGVNLRGADLHGAELNNADLSGADLGQMNLRGANLSGGDLSWAYLRDADLRGADLQEARFEDAYLEGADLSVTNMQGANLTGADLRGANLSGANCRAATFYEAAFGSTRLGDLDLSGARGLDKIRHLSPSTIGLDTVYRSRGIIPEPFLRGAGVPDSFIHFVESLAQKQERTYSCFISHSPRDTRFCDRLHADLQKYGVRVWYMPEAVATAKRFFAEIAAPPQLFDKVIVVLSRHALAEERVRRELAETLKREQRERVPVLYPVRLDDYDGKDWDGGNQPRVAARTVADFRGWNRSERKYELALQQLVTALRG